MSSESLTNEMIHEIMKNDLVTDNLATDTNEIPFVIFEAFPDCKSPSADNTFGTCDISEIPSYFINKLTLFILYQNDPEPINDLNDIEHFWKYFYADRGIHMDNPPWRATIFINNKWIDATPSNEEVMQRIRQIKSHY